MSRAARLVGGVAVAATAVAGTWAPAAGSPAPPGDPSTTLPAGDPSTTLPVDDTSTTAPSAGPSTTLPA
ncbi:MAG: CGNR zinc finger domain-containing protein, partial [Acidimicrobiales bacterium]